jgi:hypothetical protein
MQTVAKEGRMTNFTSLLDSSEIIRSPMTDGLKGDR